MKNNHLIDTTPQYYIIKVSSGSEKALISSLIPNKVETDEVELTQVAALIDTYPEKASIFDKEFAEKVWKFVD